MSNLFGWFYELQRPVQIAFGVMSGGCILMLLWILPRDPMVYVIVAAGLVVLVLLLMLYRFILRRRDKRKGKELGDGVKESSSAVPKGVDAAGRARLDDMRRKFEQGVTTFRAHGKDLYTLPWYVIIGEPGSGKTEAIRHCGIGFPPGLQDELQGSGGTLNMDWWFTDQAVILDTAGRLTFGDVAGADSVDNKEWQEFLRLLKKHRQHRPINGLIIAIPVDSLIKDDADEIERKSGKLARQLDTVQRVLGVRFPVFVVVTKADMMAGFRPFFSEMRDPHAQGQMVGWSNPAPLDEPFDPGSIDTHLAYVIERLERRRMAPLQDPVHTEDPNVRRADQVDELYALPQSVGRITSRLKRYLELIFVAGEWSSKPVFLRGVYFTSSMQEGMALDEELAEAMGVALESLQEAAWAENRAYFLRDVVVEKVFQEQGLVTSASNARAQQRKRKIWLLAAGFVVVFLIAGLSLKASYDYREIARFSVIWKVADSERGNLPIVGKNLKGDLVYRGNERIEELDLTLVAFYLECRKEASRDISTPLAFKPIAWLTGGGGYFKAGRQAACAALFEQGVIEPLVEATRDRFRKDLRAGGIDWSDSVNVAALAQLIDFETAAPTRVRTFEVYPMLEFLQDELEEALDSEEELKALAAALAADAKHLQATCNWVYDPAPQGGQPWPPRGLGIEPEFADLARVVDDFAEYWCGGHERQAGSRFAGLSELTNRLLRTEEMERELQALMPAGQASLIDREQWTRTYKELMKQKALVDEQVETLELQEDDRIETTVVDALAEEKDQVHGYFNELLAAYEGVVVGQVEIKEIRAEAPEQETETSPGDDPVAKLRRKYQLCTQRDEAEILENARTLDGRHFRRGRDVGQGRQRLYALRSAMYQRANELLEASGTSTALPFGETAGSLEELAQDIETAEGDIEDLSRCLPLDADEQTKAFFNKATGLAKQVTRDLAAEKRSREVIQGFVRKVTDEESGSVEDMVAAQAAVSGGSAIRVPRMPFTKLAQGKFDSRYDPVVAAELFRDWASICGTTATTDLFARTRDANVAEDRIGAYMGAYFRYWTEDIPDLLRLDQARFGELGLSQWDQCLNALDDISVRDYAVELEKLSEILVNALTPLRDALRAGAGSPEGCRPLENEVVQKIEDARGFAHEAPNTDLGSRIEQYRKILTAWSVHDRDASTALRLLLSELGATSAREFEEKYFVDRAALETVDREGLERFILRFWTRLPLDLLDVLIRDGSGSARKAWADLQPRRAFPIAQMQTGVDRPPQLAPEDIDEALRLAVEAGSDFQSEATRTAVRRLSPVVRNRLKALEEVHSSEIADTIGKIRAMLEAVAPPAKKGWHDVSVWVRPEEKPSDSAHMRAMNAWPDFRIIQDGKSTPVWLSGKRKPAGSLRLPGGDISFQGSFTVGGPNKLHEPPVLRGPWSALHLLSEYGTTRIRVDEGEGKSVWQVELLLTLKTEEGETTVHSLWLELEFPTVIPSLDEWFD